MSVRTVGLIGLVLLGGAMPVMALESGVKVGTETCVFVYPASDANSINAEWLCPKGVKYVYLTNFWGPPRLIKGVESDGRCVYDSSESVWLCPAGTKVDIESKMATKVPIPAN